MRPADPAALRLAVACGRAAAHAEFRGEHGLAAGLAEIARVLAAKAEAEQAPPGSLSIRRCSESNSSAPRDEAECGHRDPSHGGNR